MTESSKQKRNRKKERVMIIISTVVIVIAVASIVFFGGIDLGLDKNRNVDSVAEKTEYDEVGNLLRRELYSDGQLQEYHRYEYDSAGNLIYVGTFQQGDIPLNETWYDAEGNEIQSKAYDIGVLVHQSFDEYHDAGHTAIDEAYDGAGDLLARFTYEYSKAGAVIRSETLFPQSELWDVIEYDENGLETSIRSFYMDGSLREFITSETDADGYNTQASTEYGTDGKETGRSIQIYDKDKNLREYYEYEGEALQRRKIREYDDQGRLTKEESYWLALKQWYITEYNIHEDPVITTDYELDSEVIMVTEYKYTYADNGSKLREEKYENGEFSSADDYSYDSDWNLIQHKSYLGTNLSSVTEYYPNGKQKKYEWYLLGNLYETTHYEYDDKWSPTAREVYDDEGVLKSRLEYDSFGHKALFYEYWRGTLQKETLYEYYDDSLFSKIKTETVRYYFDGELDYFTLNQYNEEGKIRSTTYYNADGTER